MSTFLFFFEMLFVLYFFFEFGLQEFVFLQRRIDLWLDIVQSRSNSSCGFLELVVFLFESARGCQKLLRQFYANKFSFTVLFSVLSCWSSDSIELIWARERSLVLEVRSWMMLKHLIIISSYTFSLSSSCSIRAFFVFSSLSFCSS